MVVSRRKASCKCCAAAYPPSHCFPPEYSANICPSSRSPLAVGKSFSLLELDGKETSPLAKSASLIYLSSSGVGRCSPNWVARLGGDCDLLIWDCRGGLF